jgi:hypothetical protein
MIYGSFRPNTKSKPSDEMRSRIEIVIMVARHTTDSKISIATANPSKFAVTL